MAIVPMISATILAGAGKAPRERKNEKTTSEIIKGAASGVSLTALFLASKALYSNKHSTSNPLLNAARKTTLYKKIPKSLTDFIKDSNDAIIEKVYSKQAISPGILPSKSDRFGNDIKLREELQERVSKSFVSKEKKLDKSIDSIITSILGSEDKHTKEFLELKQQIVEDANKRFLGISSNTPIGTRVDRVNLKRIQYDVAKEVQSKLRTTTLSNTLAKQQIKLKDLTSKIEGIQDILSSGKYAGAQNQYGTVLENLKQERKAVLKSLIKSEIRFKRGVPPTELSSESLKFFSSGEAKSVAVDSFSEIKPLLNMVDLELINDNKFIFSKNSSGITKLLEEGEEKLNRIKTGFNKNGKNINFNKKIVTDKAGYRFYTITADISVSGTGAQNITVANIPLGRVSQLPGGEFVNVSSFKLGPTSQEVYSNINKQGTSSIKIISERYVSALDKLQKVLIDSTTNTDNLVEGLEKALKSWGRFGDINTPTITGAPLVREIKKRSVAADVGFTSIMENKKDIVEGLKVYEKLLAIEGEVSVLDIETRQKYGKHVIALNDPTEVSVLHGKPNRGKVGNAFTFDSLQSLIFNMPDKDTLNLAGITDPAEVKTITQAFKTIQSHYRTGSVSNIEAKMLQDIYSGGRTVISFSGTGFDDKVAVGKISKELGVGFHSKSQTIDLKTILDLFKQDVREPGTLIDFSKKLLAKDWSQNSKDKVLNIILKDKSLSKEVKDAYTTIFKLADSHIGVVDIGPTAEIAQALFHVAPEEGSVLNTLLKAFEKDMKGTAKTRLEQIRYILGSMSNMEPAELAEKISPIYNGISLKMPKGLPQSAGGARAGRGYIPLEADIDPRFGKLTMVAANSSPVIEIPKGALEIIPYNLEEEAYRELQSTQPKKISAKYKNSRLLVSGLKDVNESSVADNISIILDHKNRAYPKILKSINLTAADDDLLRMLSNKWVSFYDEAVKNMSPEKAKLFANRQISKNAHFNKIVKMAKKQVRGQFTDIDPVELLDIVKHDNEYKVMFAQKQEIVGGEGTVDVGVQEPMRRTKVMAQKSKFMKTITTKLPKGFEFNEIASLLPEKINPATMVESYIYFIDSKLKTMKDKLSEKNYKKIYKKVQNLKTKINNFIEERPEKAGIKFKGKGNVFDSLSSLMKDLGMVYTENSLSEFTPQDIVDINARLESELGPLAKHMKVEVGGASFVVPMKQFGENTYAVPDIFTEMYRENFKTPQGYTLFDVFEKGTGINIHTHTLDALPDSLRNLAFAYGQENATGKGILEAHNHYTNRKRITTRATGAEVNEFINLIKSYKPGSGIVEMIKDQALAQMTGGEKGITQGELLGLSTEEVRRFIELKEKIKEKHGNTIRYVENNREMVIPVDIFNLFTDKLGKQQVFLDQVGLGATKALTEIAANSKDFTYYNKYVELIKGLNPEKASVLTLPGIRGNISQNINAGHINFFDAYIPESTAKYMNFKWDKSGNIVGMKSINGRTLKDIYPLNFISSDPMLRSMIPVNLMVDVKNKYGGKSLVINELLANMLSRDFDFDNVPIISLAANTSLVGGLRAKEDFYDLFANKYKKAIDSVASVFQQADIDGKRFTSIMSELKDAAGFVGSTKHMPIKFTKATKGTERGYNIEYMKPDSSVGRYFLNEGRLSETYVDRNGISRTIQHKIASMGFASDGLDNASQKAGKSMADGLDNLVEQTYIQSVDTIRKNVKAKTSWLNVTGILPDKEKDAMNEFYSALYQEPISGLKHKDTKLFFEKQLEDLKSFHFKHGMDQKLKSGRSMKQWVQETVANIQFDVAPESVPDFLAAMENVNTEKPLDVELKKKFDEKVGLLSKVYDTISKNYSKVSNLTHQTQITDAMSLYGEKAGLELFEKITKAGATDHSAVLSEVFGIGAAFTKRSTGASTSAMAAAGQSLGMLGEKGSSSAVKMGLMGLGLAYFFKSKQMVGIGGVPNFGIMPGEGGEIYSGLSRKAWQSEMPFYQDIDSSNLWGSTAKITPSTPEEHINEYLSKGMASMKKNATSINPVFAKKKQLNSYSHNDTRANIQSFGFTEKWERRTRYLG